MVAAADAVAPAVGLAATLGAETVGSGVASTEVVLLGSLVGAHPDRTTATNAIAVIHHMGAGRLVRGRLIGNDMRRSSLIGNGGMTRHLTVGSSVGELGRNRNHAQKATETRLNPTSSPTTVKSGVRLLSER